MAIIKCPECGSDISDWAESCPKCGYPLKKKAPEAAEEVMPAPPSAAVAEGGGAKHEAPKKKHHGCLIAALVIVVVLVLLVVACSTGLFSIRQGPNTAVTSQPASTATVESSQESASTEDADDPGTVEPAKREPARKGVGTGQTVRNSNFKVKLTSARVSRVLRSSESSTEWTADDGSVFAILEFDVTALNSKKLAVDQKAIVDPVAHYHGDTYEDWEYQYIQNELWLSLESTYLEANKPQHAYVYTTVPSRAAKSGSLYVNVELAGTPCKITVR